MAYTQSDAVRFMWPVVAIIRGAGYGSGWLADLPAFAEAEGQHAI